MTRPAPKVEVAGSRHMLKIEVRPSESLSDRRRADVLALCRAAFGEDLSELMATCGAATHLLGSAGGELVSHAMWITRWLQPGERPPLETAYVEAVATHPRHQRRGYATRIMRRLVDEVPDSYELAALCPATSEVYARLGWRFWQGPLRIRTPGGTLETPDEQVMIFDLPGRPLLDASEPLSAEWREGELW